MNRKDISYNHAIFGDNYRMLEDHEFVEKCDETGCLSTLLSINHHERWKKVSDVFIGKTVKHLCEDDGDLDGGERVFRRKLPITIVTLQEQ